MGIDLQSEFYEMALEAHQLDELEVYHMHIGGGDSDDLGTLYFGRDLATHIADYALENANSLDEGIAMVKDGDAWYILDACEALDLDICADDESQVSHRMKQLALYVDLLKQSGKLEEAEEYQKIADDFASAMEDEEV